jgi:hypothetical protein
VVGSLGKWEKYISISGGDVYGCLGLSTQCIYIVLGERDGLIFYSSDFFHGGLHLKKKKFIFREMQHKNSPIFIKKSSR